MKRKELQELVTELQAISNALYSTTDSRVPLADLMRLCTLMARLKSYPQYSEMVDNILNAIEAYSQVNTREYLVAVVAGVEELINVLKEKLDNSLANILKKGYEEAKDRLDEVVPEEVQDACRETASQVKGVARKAERTAKTRLRNWLLSDDDNE